MSSKRPFLNMTLNTLVVSRKKTSVLFSLCTEQFKKITFLIQLLNSLLYVNPYNTVVLNLAFCQLIKEFPVMYGERQCVYGGL
jgi:hypothetical protein